MSGEQIRLQVPPKLFGVNSWIAQMIRQCIPDSWSGHRKGCGELASLAVDDIGRSQMLVTRNIIKQDNQ